MSTRHGQFQTEESPFLPSGSYFITNVRHDVSLSLPDRQDEICGSLERNCTWKIFNDSNERWYIQGGTDELFAHRNPSPRKGNTIIAIPQKFGWRIAQCHPTRNRDCYLIYTKSDFLFFWSLPDGEDQTPVRFCTVETDSKNWWRFHRITDEDHFDSPLPVGADLPRYAVTTDETWSGMSSDTQSATTVTTDDARSRMSSDTQSMITITTDDTWSRLSSDTQSMITITTDDIWSGMSSDTQSAITVSTGTTASWMPSEIHSAINAVTDTTAPQMLSDIQLAIIAPTDTTSSGMSSYIQPDMNIPTPTTCSGMLSDVQAIIQPEIIDPRDSTWSETFSDKQPKIIATTHPTCSEVLSAPLLSSTYWDSPPATILIMGSTGVGKSSFINTVAKRNLRVSHELDSCTKEIQEVLLKWGENERPVVLVDTPGFQHSFMSDTEVLLLIAKYLVTSYKEGKRLTGVIVMHCISDSRVVGGTRRLFKMFQKLCGSKQLTQVVILTWWDKVEKSVALSGEDHHRLDKTVLKPMVDYGARMMRHELGGDQGFSSAQAVLNHLLQYNPMVLKIQTQLAEERLPLPATDAGSVIINLDLLQDIRRCLDRLAAVQGELKKATDPATKPPLEEERRELEGEKKAFRKQIRDLSKNLNERSVLWRIFSAMGL